VSLPEIVDTDDVLDDDLRKSLPADCIDAMERALLLRRSRLRYVRALDGGFTDARVLVVVNPGGDLGASKMILKVDRVGLASAEADLHAAACAADSEFTARHLVDQPLPPIDLGGGWTAMFQSIAGGSFSDYRTLSAILDTAAVPDVVGQVCETVLTGWRPLPELEMIDIATFIRQHVRRKLDDDGSLSRWVTEQYGAGALSAAGLVFADDPERIIHNNPLVCVREPARWPADLARINAIVGNAHGDLHPGNIMVPMPHGKPDGAEFRLIDLSAYSGRTPLTRDPVNLLLAIVACSLPGGDDDRRQLRDVLLGKVAPNLPSTIAPLCQVVDRVYAAGRDEMRRRGLTSIPGNGFGLRFERRSWGCETAGCGGSPVVHLRKFEVWRRRRVGRSS
jgi:hypothetical protein